MSWWVLSQIITVYNIIPTVENLHSIIKVPRTLWDVGAFSGFSGIVKRLLDSTGERPSFRDGVWGVPYPNTIIGTCSLTEPV